jgi:DNA-binding CsgD family transcriptional regulator
MTGFLEEARSTGTDAVPPAALVCGLIGLVPGVFCSFWELDLPTRRLLNYRDSDDLPGGPRGDCVYWQLRHQSPTCRYAEKTGRLDVVQVSDFISTRELRRRQIYDEIFRPHGVEHIIAVPLPTTPGRTRVFQIGREPGGGFTETERDMLTLLQPHLYQLYQHAASRRSPHVRLTQRQLEVLRCVALGMTNDETARQLSISPGTVGKHLENAYTRLGVTSRTAAVAQAFGNTGNA